VTLQTDPVEVEDDQRFGLFNLQPEARVAALVALLEEPDRRPKVAVLSGAPGAGGGYLLGVALARLRAAGQAWEMVDLDLDGSEPDAGSAEAFLRHAVARRPAGERVELGRALRPLVEIAGSSGFAPALISTLLGLVRPVRELLGLIEAVRTHPLPQLPAGERLVWLLETLAAQGHLALLLRKPSQATEPLRRLLVQVCERCPTAALVVRALPIDRTDLLVPPGLGAPPVRIELPALGRAELAEVVATRFAPNRFPAALADALWKVTAGSTRELAARLGELVRTGGLMRDDDGVWMLPDDDLEAAPLVRVFSFAFYDPIDRLIRGLPSPARERLCEFLAAAVVCGDNVPADVALAVQGLDRERADEVIDLVDDTLVQEDGDGDQDGGLRVFRDLGYQHPGLPNLKVYTFINPILRLAIRDRLSLPPRRWAELARAVVDLLERAVPATTRARAEIHLAAATFLEDSAAREYHQQRLAWWIASDEAEALTEHLVNRLTRRELAPEVLLRLIREIHRKWPAFRLKALIDAYDGQPDGIPVAELGPLHVLRAMAFRELGKVRAAFSEARAAIRFFEANGDQTGLRSALITAAGSLLHLQRFRAARRLAETAFKSAQRDLAPSDPEFLLCAYTLAVTLRFSGELRGAQEVQEVVVATVEHLEGEEAQLGFALISLADILLDLDEPQRALPLLDRASALLTASYGPIHWWVVPWERSQAKALARVGRLMEARHHLEHGISVSEQLTGSGRPDMARGLGLVLEQMGDLPAAEAALARALLIADNVEDGSVGRNKIVEDLARVRSKQAAAATSSPVPGTPSGS
jgi:tetratricopeptide (TPR) repeat protein